MDAADMLAVLGGLCTVPTRQPPVALRFASPLQPRKAHARNSSRTLRKKSTHLLRPTQLGEIRSLCKNERPCGKSAGKGSELRPQML